MAWVWPRVRTTPSTGPKLTDPTSDLGIRSCTQIAFSSYGGLGSPTDPFARHLPFASQARWESSVRKERCDETETWWRGLGGLRRAPTRPRSWQGDATVSTHL